MKPGDKVNYFRHVSTARWKRIPATLVKLIVSKSGVTRVEIEYLDDKGDLERKIVQAESVELVR